MILEKKKFQGHSNIPYVLLPGPPRAHCPPCLPCRAPEWTRSSENIKELLWRLATGGLNKLRPADYGERMTTEQTLFHCFLCGK